MKDVEGGGMSGVGGGESVTEFERKEERVSLMANLLFPGTNLA